MEGVEHTCATCDHYEYGWDGRRKLPCGLCWLKWDMMRGNVNNKLEIVSASICMVEGTGTCDEWTEKDDD